MTSASTAGRSDWSGAGKHEATELNRTPGCPGVPLFSDFLAQRERGRVARRVGHRQAQEFKPGRDAALELNGERPGRGRWNPFDRAEEHLPLPRPTPVGRGVSE